MVGARRQATVPVRSADLRQGEGRRISVRSRAESARRPDRATILNAQEITTMSDHFSGPAVMGDPSVDITDFYAFPSPERPGNLVLIMDVFPMATPQSLFSDVVTYRFRLRPLTRSGGGITHGDGGIHDRRHLRVMCRKGPRCSKGTSSRRTGARRASSVGKPLEQDGMRVFAGLVSDPFFMDVEAAIRTDISGKLSFDTAINTVHFRDVLSIVVEVPFAPIVERFDGVTLIARHRGDHRHAPRQADPDRTSRSAGDQELRSWPTRCAIRARRASSFAISTTGRTPLRSPRNIGRSTSRVSTQTWRSSTASTARPRGRSDRTGAIRCAIC